MRVKNISFIVVLVMALCAVGSANAQGLGGLLKKAKNAADKVTETAKSVSESEDIQNVVGKITGATVINPISKYIEVEPVGLYGISQTETSGNVYLVLNVLNKTDKQNALFGSSVQNQKMLAVDGKGKVYNVDASGGIRYDTPQDVPVKVVIDDPQLQFMNVSNTLDVMPVVKIGIALDANHQGNLTFKNLPILWDVDPEDLD
ncbi:MAG: hypothetical protein HDR88_12870 [Bacteroides sp.]|nr:hypothetical protein [Bacteroides sp.]